MWSIPQDIYDRQRWGARVVAPTAGNDFENLIRVQLPPQLARAWSLQLHAPIGADGSDSFGSPSAQAASALATAALPTTDGATVRVQYGHGARMETVYCDWPARGGSVVLPGNFVDVAVLDKNSAANRAQYAATLVPADGMPAPSGILWQPRVTVAVPNTAANVEQFFTIPRRAIGYAYHWANTVYATVTSRFYVSGVLRANIIHSNTVSFAMFHRGFDPLPIPSGATAIGIQAATPPADLKLLWYLAL